MSCLSAPVFQSRMPEPYIKLNPADAAKLGVNPGAMLSFSVEGQTLRLPLVISEGLTAGQVGLPMGMPGIAPVLTGSRIDSLQGGESMSWLTPDLIDILLSILKAVVILLVACHLRRVHELRRASSARLVPEPLRT